eukprot:TRINITY_DN18060_c0_g1_i1.p1 TRINITY_DN18060_c0_g1~~TRINITY_DN18060_c0_g1_i1.p1  ORF type:complete len:370 (-),score=113.62 TRINITY_DN18060_c0_g1_i1:117-1226(-)
MAMAVTVAGFTLERQRYYVRCEWREDSFGVVLLDGVRVYAGEAGQRRVRELRPDGMPAEQYVALVREALSRQDVGGRFTYSVSSARNGRTLGWRIKLGKPAGKDKGDSEEEGEDEAGAELFWLVGSVELEEVAEEERRAGVLGVLDHLASRAEELAVQCGQLADAAAVADARRTEAAKALEALAAAKARMEQDMYKKFVVVLNEKKARIRRVTTEADELRAKLKEADTRALPAQQAPPAQKQPSQHQPPDHPSQQVVDGADSDNGEACDEDEASLQATFANVLGPTPSLELLATADTYDVPQTVRRRHRTDNLATSQHVVLPPPLPEAAVAEPKCKRRAPEPQPSQSRGGRRPRAQPDADALLRLAEAT